MKCHTILWTLGAFAISTSSGVFAQGNQSGSSQGLNAGDNVQAAPAHNSTHTRKMKPSKPGSDGAPLATQPGGTAVPGGPNAPVSASGSGQ
jgi:hypothetical protein